MSTRLVTGVLLALAVVGWLLVAAPQPAAASAGGAEAGHQEASKGTDGLNPLKSWREDLAIWTAVVFLVLLLVLGKFAWGPIAQGLAKREQAIAEQIAQAERNNRQAQELLGQYEQKLADSEQEIRKMIDAARREADEAGREIVAQARQDAQGEHQRALREIEAATSGAIKELADRSATLAVELAGKIVGAELKPGAHAALIAETVAGFPKAKAGANGNT
jgi:F-type H+-transporting ATPase subunit b